MAMQASLPSDETLQRDILNQMKCDARVQPNEIGVSVNDGIAILTGYADSYMKRWAAEDATHNVKGVRAVANDIEVRLPNSMQRTDPDLAEHIIEMLQWDALIPLDKLGITVSNGWVTIKGDVDFAFQRSDAEHIIDRVAGVRGVTNLIQVKPQVQSVTIKQDIEQALSHKADLDAQNITVEIEGDKVTLRGSVHSYAEYKEAEQTAWLTPGVAHVEKQLTIDIPT